MNQPYSDPDVGKTPKRLFEERTKRLQDALQLKQPDRIPIQLDMSYMLAEMYGVTRQEQHENAEKEQEMLEKAALYFQPDSIMGVFNNPGPSLAVGDRMTEFPGHGMDPNGSFQFVEGEYMKAEDYGAFIEDPADWSIRKYWPRVFTELEGLALLPPLGLAAFGTYSLPQLGIFKAPPVAKALRALAQAVEAQAAADTRAVTSGQKLAALGFALPTLIGSVTEAPSISCRTRYEACGASCSTSTAGPKSCSPPRKRSSVFSLSMPSALAGPPASMPLSFPCTAVPTALCRCPSSRNSTGPS